VNQGTILRSFAWASKFAATAFAVVAIGASTSLLVALAVESAAGATGTCAGKKVYPGDDLVAIAKQCGPGSVFYVNDGNYSVDQSIAVDSNDVWAGVYSDGSRPQIRGVTTPQVFNVGSSDGATIGGLAISGADGTPACRPTCGRGVHGGMNLTLKNVRLYENANQGAGGQHTGLVIRDSEIDHNGISEFYEDPTYASAAGVKSVNSFAVYNSFIHDNAWNGVWCDLECGTLEVHDSELVRNGKSGIFYEVTSGHAVIEGNYFAGNGKIASPMYRQPAGLSVTSSQNLNAYGNTFAGNNLNYGFWAIEDSRKPDLANIAFHDNTMNNDALRGCALSGVSCKNNN
jgi:hypothetical protein